MPEHKPLFSTSTLCLFKPNLSGRVLLSLSLMLSLMMIAVRESPIARSHLQGVKEELQIGSDGTSKELTRSTL